jgi:hypothetical protein
MIFNNYEHIDSQFDKEIEFNNNYIDQNLFKGAHVVLVSEENPWYINKGIPKKYISEREFLNDIYPYSRGMYPYEQYKSDVKLDTTLPDLGLGHSIIQRRLVMEGKDFLNTTENFNSTKSDIMNRNILIVILLLLILFLLYNQMSKN